MFEVPDSIFLAGVCVLAVWALIRWLRGITSSFVILALTSAGIGLLMGSMGLAHTINVVASKVASHKPYDFRFVGLICVGLILVYTGAINFAMSWWIRRGRMWALAVSTAASLLQWVFLLLLLPIPAPARRVGLLLQACFLCLVLLRWNATRDASKADPESRFGLTVLALVSLAQLILVFGSVAVLGAGRDHPEAGYVRGTGTSVSLADFIASPTYIAIIGVAFICVAVWQGRLTANHCRRFGWWMVALGAVAVTATLRMGLEVYLRAVAGASVFVTAPKIADIAMYCLMFASFRVRRAT